MADNALPSTDPNVATDDVAGVHFQRMKLVDGTLDGTDAIPGTADRGLSVDPRQKIVRVSVTPVITAGAYAQADVVGGELTFANAVRAAGATGEIRKVIVSDKAGLNANVDLWLFRNAFASPIADNAAWSVPATELDSIVAGIPIYTGDWLDMGTTNAVAKPCAETIVCDGTDLTGYLVLQEAKTFASTSDLTITLLIAQD